MAAYPSFVDVCRFTAIQLSLVPYSADGVDSHFTDGCQIPPSPMRGGRVASYVSEPYEKNEFLQSLEEEEEYKKNPNTTAHRHDNQKDPTEQLNGVENQKQQDRARIECLENGVQYWTDYSKVQFHPLSLYEIQGLWKDVMPFDDYGTGRGIVTEHSQAEELSNRLRFFVEECDHMQGFQFLVDDSGGFATIAADFLEIMADEYVRIPIVLYTARDPSSYSKVQNSRSSITRGLHDAISFIKLSSFSGLMVPVGLPSLAKRRGGQAFVSEVRESVYGVHQGPPRGSSICHLSVSRCPLPIPLPFPCIFGNSIGQHGEILGTTLAGNRGRGALDISSIPMATRLRSTKAILPFLEKRLQDLRMTSGSAGGQVLEGWGFQKAEVQDLGESLSELVLAFDGASMETSSDSD